MSQRGYPFRRAAEHAVLPGHVPLDHAPTGAGRRGRESGRAEIEAVAAEQGVRSRVCLALLGRSGGNWPAVLLDHVRDFVGQQPQALGRVRRERLPAEEDVRAYGQRGGPERAADLINLGAYVSGSNPKLDAAIRSRPQLIEFLKQDAAVNAPYDETIQKMQELAKLTA